MLHDYSFTLGLSVRLASPSPDKGRPWLPVLLAATWSVKGARDMVEPHVVIRVRDQAGKLLEAVQESPSLVCFPSDADKLSLGFSWHLQTPLNCLPESAAVFFELQHYKLAKKKVRWAQQPSAACWLRAWGWVRWGSAEQPP